MSLQGCVASLSSSCHLLASSLNTLDSGIHDFPRLIQVLQNTRHFELLPESEVFAAGQALRGDIGPQMEELQRRAEKGLLALERREYALKSKRELQEVRLQQKPNRSLTTTTTTTAATASTTTTAKTSREIGTRGDEAAATVENAERAERLKVLRSRKERLAYSLKRLQMEEQGRKTRMSLAPGYAFGSQN